MGVMTDLSGVKVYLKPSCVWAFFNRAHNRLKREMVKIAENIETKYAVYIDENYDHLRLHVCKGDEPPEYTEIIVSKDGCTSSVLQVFRQYLFPVTEFKDDKFGEKTVDRDKKQEEEDEQYERDDELRLATFDFLAVLLESDVDTIMSEFDGAEVESIMDEIFTGLYEAHGISVRRPMFITDEDENEVFSEYPYERYEPDEENDTV